MKTFILLVIPFCILIISSCKDDSTTTSNEYNSVSIRSVNDTLAISISTANHNYNQTVPVVFTVDTLKFSLTVSGYGNGSGLFKLMRDTNVLYSKDLNSNYQASELLVLGTLTDAVLNLQNYKGNVNILLTK